MEPEQARAARAILRLGVREVAEATGVTPNTVSRIEAAPEEGKRGPQRSTIATIRAWYEAQGLQFLSHQEAADGPGVAMRSDPDG